MSRQNSRDVSSLEVTLRGSQIEIEPIGNGTKTIDDVKVLLLKGEKGDTPSEMAHSIKVYDANGNVHTYNGSADVAIYNRNVLVTVPVSGWSGTVNSEGYYTNTVSLGVPFNTYDPVFVSPIGSTKSTKATPEQSVAFNLCEVFSFADGTSVSSMVAKAKTKPTTTFYALVSGDYIG